MSEASRSMPEPAPGQTRQVLLESLGMSITDVRCRAHAHEAEGPEEPQDRHAIVFVRRGVFRRRVGGENLVADANHVLFFNAAEPYRFSHPLPGGDDCTSLGLPAALALELVAGHAPGDAERPEAPFRVGQALSSARAMRLHYELLALVRRGVTGLPVEDVLAELADEAVASAYRAQGATRVEGLAARRARELVEAVKLALGGRLESPPRLGELAAALGCSPFHVSRTFARTAGLSLRRYLGQLRTRAAADRLAEGARDLTALALDLGFADHSHMTNAFRREWGIPPSRFRHQQRPQ